MTVPACRTPLLQFATLTILPWLICTTPLNPAILPHAKLR